MTASVFQNSDSPVTADQSTPLVSCVMVTANRPKFVPQAVRLFQQQDYPNLELLVVDDGADPVDHVLPANEQRIHYVRLTSRHSIGEKRNIGCQLAQGEIIATWDDDDWYAPERISRQIQPIVTNESDISGLQVGDVLDLNEWALSSCDVAKYSHWTSSPFHDGTLVFRKAIWEKLTKYRKRNIAEDAFFRMDATQKGARLSTLPNRGSFVYVRHGRNSWRGVVPVLKRLGALSPTPSSAYPAFSKDDLNFYSALSPATVPETQNASTELFSENDSRSSKLSTPLVSCIMPTYNRRQFVPHAIRYFLRQDYDHRELVIVDDGSDPIDDLLPSDERIHYIRLSQRMSVGAKRNIACEHSKGEIIVHWDDDDWHASRRVRYHVEALTKHHSAEVCGTNRVLYFDPTNRMAWLYQRTNPQSRWVLGNSLAYTRALWRRNPFRELQVGEDNCFLRSSAINQIVNIEDYRIFVGLVHADNVSPKRTTDAFWHPVDLEEVEKAMAEDSIRYRDWAHPRS